MIYLYLIIATAIASILEAIVDESTSKKKNIEHGTGLICNLVE